MPPRAKGGKDIKWRRPVYEESEEGATAEIVATGLYDLLRAERPKVKTLMRKLVGPEYIVKRVRLEPGRTNDGVLSVNLLSNGAGENGPDPIYERDWGVRTVEIEEHPRAPKLDPNRPWYPYPNRPHDPEENPRVSASDAEGFRNPKFAYAPWGRRTHANWDVLDDEDMVGDSAWTPDQYRSLKEGSRHSFDVSFPIARATTYHATEPPSAEGNIMQIDAPPGACGAPAGWLYVLTVDRAVNQAGRWQRIREWEGRFGVDAGRDALIYG